MFVANRIGMAAHATEWLSLAATPTFALMAVLAGGPLAGAHKMSCSSAANMSPLNGMVVMYALMSAFHCLPWLRLIAHRRSLAHAS